MFQLAIKTDNAAFEDNESVEIARILRDIAEAVEGGVLNGRARDINGNSAATFTYSAD